MENETTNVEVLMPKSKQPGLKNLDTVESTWRNSYAQIIGACIVHMLTIQAGINMAFSAILVPQLQKFGNDIQLESSEVPWIASLVTISLPIGSLISGPLMDRFGRRNVSLLICIPYLISWILIFWSYNVVWLYVARVLAGAAAGISNVAIFYTSEIANPLWRPMLLGLNSVFVSLGILLTAVFGMFFYWRTVAVIFAVLTTTIFFLITILPESPHWLLSFDNGTQDLNRISDARKSLKWFNRNEFQAERELNQLLINYRDRNVSAIPKTETFKQKWESLKRPEIYKPISLLLIIFFFQQSSGFYVIVFYANLLFKDLGGKFGFLDEYGAMIVMGVIRFIMAIIALILSRKFGRRALCMISGSGMGVSILAAFIYEEFGQTEDRIPVLLCVLSFVCFGAIGWQTIPWSLTGELLPTRFRAIVGGIMISYAYLLMFLVVITFPALKELIHVKGVFLLFSVSSFASTVFIWKFLPETFGKSLAEIERFFK